MTRDHLDRLDAALLALRRLTDLPPGRTTLEHGGDRVEVSTVLVVDAVARTDGGCSVGHVAEALRVTHSTASRLVERAAAAGMVQRGRDAGDPRRARISLTAAGQDLQRAAVAFRTARLAEVLDDWPAADVAAFTDLIERFAQDARRPTPPRRGTT